MADEQKLVKVRILKPVSGWQVGQIVEVPENIATHMTTERHINNGTRLEAYKTAEFAGEGDAVTTAADFNTMTVKDMADLGLKNVVSTPSNLAADPATGNVTPRLSTTTNESIPVDTGASLASVAISQFDQEDLSATEGAGYDGANIVAQSRDDASSAGAKANQGKSAKVSKIADAKPAAPGLTSAPHAADHGHARGSKAL